MFIDQYIKNFESLRKKSVLCRLTLGDLAIPWERINSGDNMPFTFVLFYSKTLEYLDNIFRDFMITNETINNDFKKRLQDPFLENNPQKFFKKHKGLVSSVVELVVADYLRKKCREEVELLNAREADKGRMQGSDIVSKCSVSKKEYFTEVKYLAMIPDLYWALQQALEQGKAITGGWGPSLSESYNYLNIRIADAVFQFDKNNLPLKKRRVFIVLDPINFINTLLIRNVCNKLNWHDLSWKQLTEKLKCTQANWDVYLENHVQTYYERSGRLTICIRDNGYSLKKAFDTDQAEKIICK